MTDSGTPMGLARRAIDAVGALLNGKSHPEHGEIAHLAGAAARGAEALVYLASIDDARFGDHWPNDDHNNDSVDDGHVRWAATGATSSLDHCIAAAGRLAGFAKRTQGKEDSIRTFYRLTAKNAVVDERHLVQPPWRAWIDAVVSDGRYAKLLAVRNALVHADAFRIIHGTTHAIGGHQLRYGYRIGTIGSPAPSGVATVTAREVVELSRDVALDHVAGFLAILEQLS